jgi:DNA (cytosine-5)-methyltransferase 1
MPHTLNSLSFFSGCLGLDLGLESAGITTRLACDFDKVCRATIAANRPDLPVIDDLLNYDSDKILNAAGLRKEQVDLIVGGPPCQAFSTAGKRQAFSDPRGNVFLYFLEIIREIKPKYIVIENVRGLLSAGLNHVPHDQRAKNYSPLKEELPGSALCLVTEILEEIGYSLNFNLYNAANYGVPQKRERVIIIGTLDKIPVQFLKPTHSESGDKGLPTWNTFKGAVSGLKESHMMGLQFPGKRIRFYEMLKPGQYWKNLPSEELKIEALGKSYFSGGGKTGFLRRLHWDKPSPTLVTHPAMPATDLAHPSLNRPLTVEEYKRLQCFPDNWILTGSLLQKYKQLGNAVPVKLGAAVGNAILSHSNGEKWDDKDFVSFPYSRYRNTSYSEWKHSFYGQLEQLNARNLEFNFG